MMKAIAKTFAYHRTAIALLLVTLLVLHGCGGEDGGSLPVRACVACVGRQQSSVSTLVACNEDSVTSQAGKTGVDTRSSCMTMGTDLDGASASVGGTSWDVVVNAAGSSFDPTTSPTGIGGFDAGGAAAQNTVEVIPCAGTGGDPSQDQTIAQFVEELACAIEVSSCPEVCPMVTVVASSAPPRPSSQGKRILLIDDGIAFAASTRYASRTLAFLKAEQDGSYQESAPSYEIPAEAYAILKRVDEFVPPVRATELNLAQPFANKFYDKFREFWFGHGSDSQAFLAEKVPEAQFVISESRLEFRNLCALLDDETATSGWAALEARFAATRNTLTESIQKYGVNFVHLSSGMDYDGLIRIFDYDCGRTPSREVASRILGMYVDLFRAFTSLQSFDAWGRLQPVLLFQAGASADNRDDYLVDCAEIPGRIRVVSASYAGYAVPRGGLLGDYSILSAPERRGLDCNDVYMVMGYTSIFSTPRTKYFQSLPLGLGAAARPVWPPTPSFANPIALSHFVCLTQRYPTEGASSWLDHLTLQWQKPILDPLLYDEFPVMRDSCVDGAIP